MFPACPFPSFLSLLLKSSPLYFGPQQLPELHYMWVEHHILGEPQQVEVVVVQALEDWAKDWSLLRFGRSWQDRGWRSSEEELVGRSVLALGLRGAAESPWIYFSLELSQK